MKTITNFLKQGLKKFPLSFNLKLSLFFYLFFLLFLHFAKHGIQVQAATLTNVFKMALGIISISLLTQAFDYLIHKKWPKKIAFLALYSTYLFLGFYHYRMETFFDIKLLVDNFEIIFYNESMELISSRVKTKDIVFLIFSFTLLIFFGVIKNKFVQGKVLPNKKKGFLLLTTYIAITFSPFSAYEEVSIFLKDGLQYFIKPISLNSFAKSLLEKDYPYLNFGTKKSNSNSHRMGSQRPHIFIIPIESFNSNFVEQKTPEGKAYTPFFNSLISKGLYVDSFFGNSMQTAKGHFPLLCSLTPKTVGKAFQDDFKTNFYCLPEILKKAGYENRYYQSYGDLNFDNKLIFFKENNFDIIESVDISQLTNEERKNKIWGWGPQDDVLYKYIFKKLDQDKTKKPYFVFMQGVSSHMNFDQVPKDQRLLYPDNNTKKEKYSNALRVTDKYLETFFTELNKRPYLNNSLIIITGDHSFPVGEHGLYHSERSFYNEFFKVPLLIIWNRHLKPERIKSLSFSQMDIPPTILDLLKINVKTHFQGKSILKKERTLQYLVQPYSGKFLSIVDFPFKYVFHEKSRKEFLFNLVKDQKETFNLKNIQMSDKIQEKLEFFREKLGYFYANDILIEENRIWKD